ncbi:MAG: hypothetical protein Q8P67_25055 [archaeon]|nr:hypothetical protein [archaeon]
MSLFWFITCDSIGISSFHSALNRGSDPSASPRPITLYLPGRSSATLLPLLLLLLLLLLPLPLSCPTPRNGGGPGGPRPDVRVGSIFFSK